MPSKKSQYAKRDRNLALLVLIIGFCICFTLIASFRYIIIGIFALVIIFFIYRYWKRKKKVNQGDFYTIEHHCPRCGRINVFKYAQGHSYRVTVNCWYCHIDFTK